MSGHRNSFDGLRLALALIVLVEHTQTLSGALELAWFTRYFDANFAVKGFFAISGYLVTKSFQTSASFAEYAEKRARRIVPAYVLVVMYCVAIGALMTDLNALEFVTNWSVYKYLFANLAFLNFLQPTLPGVFTENYSAAMDGSLWTIKIELMLYCVVPLLVLGYSRIGPVHTGVLAFLAGALWYTLFEHGLDGAFGSMIARQMPGQLPYFAVGSVLGSLKFSTTSVRAIVLGGVLYLALHKSLLNENAIEYVNMVVFPVFVIALGQSTYLSFDIGRVGDLSYGVDLFHFPTIQVLVDRGVYADNAYLGLVFGIAATFVLAFLSWHFVEKRFLKRSSHYLRAA